MADLNGVTLPDDIIYTNEFDTTPVTQNLEWSAAGNLQVTRHKKTAGIPININCHWVTQATINALELLKQVDGIMVLTIADGRQFNVMFNQSESPLVYKQLELLSDYQDADKIELSMNFFTV